MCNTVLILMGFLVAFMAYYMVTIRERCDDINKQTK